MTEDNEFPHDDGSKEAGNDWASNEPPVDDFGDPSAEESAMVSEDGESHQEEAVKDTAPAEKKKSPLVLLAALGVVGALLAAGGYAYMHLNGQGEYGSSLLDQAAEQQQATPPTPPSQPTATTTTDVAPKTAYTPSTDVTPSPPPKAVPDVSAQVPDTVKPATAPTVPAVAATIPAAPSPTAAPVPPAITAPATIVPAPAESNARIADMQNRIDALQKALSQATQQLQQINDKLANAPAAPQGMAAPTTAAEDERLGKLEQKLMQLEQHQVVRPHSTSASDGIAVDTPVRKARHIATRTRVVHQKAAPVAVKAKWVLRAATPEEAWVAKDAETRQLRPVHVGDELPGIGRVSAIQQTSNGWVLKGAMGTIR